MVCEPQFCAELDVLNRPPGNAQRAESRRHEQSVRSSAFDVQRA